MIIRTNLAARIAVVIIMISFAAHIFAADNCARFEPLQNENHFILVVDKSGSMMGQPLNDAKFALKEFIKNMKNSDKAAILEFSDGVGFAQRLTNNKAALTYAADKIDCYGGTHLYDAVGRALMEVRGSNTPNIIIFMTDGHDFGSSLNAANLANMCPSEGVFVYGIGLGDVDQSALKMIAIATGGSYDYTASSGDLRSLYTKVLSEYYTNFGDKLQDKSQIVLRSFPKDQPVFVNGQRMGSTPVLISNLSGGSYSLKVEFPAGNWTYNLNMPMGQKAYVDARESDVPKNIAIMSTPHNGMTFIDGQFVGYTSSFGLKKSKEKKGFIFKKEIVNLDFTRELIVPAVPKGQHTVKIVAISDDGFENFFAPVEYSFYMGNENLVMDVDCRTGEVETTTTNKQLKPSGQKHTDPFDELDSEFGDDF